MSNKLATGLLLLMLLSTAVSSWAVSPEAMGKIAPWVIERTSAGGTSSFIVVLAAQADTSGAAWLGSKEEKGQYVFDVLKRTAEETQGPVTDFLDKRGVPYRAFWIVNMITVESGDASLVLDLASRDDVKYIEGNPTIRNHLPTQEEAQARDQRLAEVVRDLASGRAPEAIAWGISNTNAPAVWTAGFSGANIVVGGEDTGVYWQHGELQGKYRGWNGTSADHNYNWHDSVHSGGNSGNCTGPNMTAPCDDGAGGPTYHGTHTMGTMVGGDGSGPSANDYGMAYGAKWIACRNMDRGNGTPTLYIECHQWMLAPTNLAGANPDPAKAPHVINNSWGCPASEGCPSGSGILLASIQALVNAGIVYEASAGNDGPGCGSVDTGAQAGPPAFYAKPWVFSTGALSSPSTLVSFSSLGPVTTDGSGRIKPDISAPGSSILSAGCCTPTATATMSGTSMAGPHVCGAVALLLNARPALAGQVERVLYALEQSTVHDVVNGGQPGTCGTTAFGVYPSNFYGWGRLNVQAAMNSVCTPAQMATPLAPVLTPACTSMGLSWTAVGSATDYEVWRASASSCRPMYQVVSTTSGATTYNDSGLTVSTPYSYYILAKNGICATVAGPCATSTTLASCVPPPEDAPGTSAATAQGWTNKTTTTWPAATGATSYTLYYGLLADLPALTSSAAESCIKYTGPATSTATITEDPSAKAGRFFWYLVTGSNSFGEGTAGSYNLGAGPVSRVMNIKGAGCPP